jgi:TonB family protein
MNIYLIYSSIIHFILITLLFVFFRITVKSVPKQYYIDFIGQSNVMTVQNPVSAVVENKDISDNTDTGEKIEKVKGQKSIANPKQVDDPDYLYTNSKNMKPSMALEESQILKKGNAKKSINTDNNSDSGIENSGIRTDSNFPYPWYITTLRTRLFESWQSQDVTSKNLKAVVRFRILRNGVIDKIHIDKTSGNRLFDQSVIMAVSEIKQIEPLPDDFFEDYLTVYVEFKTLE